MKKMSGGMKGGKMGSIKGAGYVSTGGPGKAAQRKMNMKPAGGKFEGGASSFKPKGMKIQKMGE